MTTSFASEGLRLICKWLKGERLNSIELSIEILLKYPLLYLAVLQIVTLIILTLGAHIILPTRFHGSGDFQKIEDLTVEASRSYQVPVSVDVIQVLLQRSLQIEVFS